MNILFIVPYVPNLIRVRPYNLIRHLSKKGHRVTVVTLYVNEDEKSSITALQEVCEEVIAVQMPTWQSLWNCLANLPREIPLQSVYSWNLGLARKIRELVSSPGSQAPYDVIHVEHLRGARYGLDVKTHLAERNSLIPVIWDSVDSISLLFRQAITRSRNHWNRGLLRLELSRSEHYEGWLVDQFDRVLVTSSRDKKSLLSLNRQLKEERKVVVVRNGVDLNYFKPGNRDLQDPNTVVLSGKMSYHANVAMALSFVEEIMPYVWAKRPEINVVIVGKDPPKKVQALGGHPNVLVTGTVPDIRTYLQRSALVVAPLSYSVGIQNKVLEAMACGTPVIASSKAVSALNVVSGRDVILADNRDEFVEKILSLMSNPVLREETGKAGRKYVEENHDWNDVITQLETIYTDQIDQLKTDQQKELTPALLQTVVER